MAEPGDLTRQVGQTPERGEVDVHAEHTRAVDRAA
jgi:hypothetical protein